LTVADDQSSKSAETLKSLVAVLLGSLLANRGIDSASVTAGNLLSLPNEVLDHIAMVLREKEDLGLLNDLAEIGNEFLTFGRELLRRSSEGGFRENTVESNIDLLVLWAIISKNVNV